MKINEIFGPTIQGEGPEIGRKCYFVRFAGCDSRCVWCDTKYAWGDQHVPDLSVEDVLNNLAPATANCVVLTGGNPCMQDLSQLVRGLQNRGFEVAVETQGTIWQPWVDECDLVVISPKGPSSQSETSITDLTVFLLSTRKPVKHLKFVVGNKEDLAYALSIHEKFPSIPVTLQVAADESDDHIDLLGKLVHLLAMVQHDSRWMNVRVLPQLHRLMWGKKRGV
jgi:7-carboxy-7-deazaguanine synthase